MNQNYYFLNSEITFLWMKFDCTSFAFDLWLEVKSLTWLKTNRERILPITFRHEDTIKAMSVRNFFLNNIFTFKGKLFPIFKWIEGVDGTYSWRLYYRERSWRLSTAHEYPSYRLQLPKATHMFILFSCNNGFFNLTTAHLRVWQIITMIAQSAVN